MPNLTSIELGVNGYCTMEAVRNLNPQRLYGTGSRPTEIMIVDKIRTRFDMINQVLANLGYEVPVISTANASALRTLSRFNALPVAAETEEETVSVTNQPSNHADKLWERFKMDWGEFSRGKMTLEIDRKGTHIPRRTERQAEYQFVKDASGNDEGPVFTKDMDW